MVTLILNKEEQNFEPKQIEKTIQALRRDWRQKNFDFIEDDMVHIHE
jgi:hypothetical protein